MTKRLNLFYVALEQSRMRQAQMHKLQTVCVFLSIICLTAIFCVFYYQTSLQSQIDEIQRQKDSTNKMIDEGYPAQLEYSAIATRVRRITELKKTEVQYMKQFAKVQNFLNSQEVDAVINDFSTPDYRSFKFQLLFPSQNSLIQFVKAVESGAFNATFKTLKLSGFTINTKNVDVEPSISITGEFL